MRVPCKRAHFYLKMKIYKNHFEPVIHASEKVQPDFHIGIKVGYITAMQEDIFIAYSDLNHLKKIMMLR